MKSENIKRIRDTANAITKRKIKCVARLHGRELSYMVVCNDLSVVEMSKIRASFPRYSFSFGEI